MYNIKDKIFTYHSVNGSYNFMNFFNDKYIPFSLLFNLFSDNQMKSTDIPQRFKDCYNRVSLAKNAIKPLEEWIEDIPYRPYLIYNSIWRDLSSKLYEMLQEELYFRRTKFRGGDLVQYTKGYYTLLDEQMNKGYFMLVLKKEYIKYIKLSLLTQEEITEDCFEFWYDSELLNTDLKAKRACTKILKDFKLIDVPCFDKPNFLDLFQVKVEFKAPTISKQKELLNEFVKEFQTEELKSL